MIKTLDMQESNNVKVNVIFKNGREILGADIPENLFNDRGFVAVFEGGALLLINKDEIATIKIYED